MKNNQFIICCDESLTVAFVFVMPEPTIILNSTALDRALKRIAHEIAERNENGRTSSWWNSTRRRVSRPATGCLLKDIWAHVLPTGTLDVSHASRRHLARSCPKCHPTVIPFDVTGKTVVLVDDVLFSGRTIRAALDALNDFGRPQRVQLAVLIDRGHRELPIKADFVGKNVPTSLRERVNVQMKEDGGRGHRDLGENMNDEFPMTNVEGMTKPPKADVVPVALIWFWEFGFNSSFAIRHSSFSQ